MARFLIRRDITNLFDYCIIEMVFHIYRDSSIFSIIKLNISSYSGKNNTNSQNCPVEYLILSCLTESCSQIRKFDYSNLRQQPKRMLLCFETSVKRKHAGKYNKFLILFFPRRSMDRRMNRCVRTIRLNARTINHRYDGVNIPSNFNDVTVDARL